MSDEGSLKLHLLEAHLTHGSHGLGKMDPYVKFQSREQEFKSSVDKNGGKNPKWHGQHWEIEVHYLGDELHYHVFDDDIGKDDSIGKGSTKLSALVHNGGVSEWFEIQHKGEPAGKIHLQTEWHPKHHHGHHH